MADTIDVLNPATLEVVDRLRVMGERDIGGSVEASANAQIKWAGVPFEDRARALDHIAADIEADSEALARLLTTEQGKPLSESRKELDTACQVFRYYASLTIHEDVVRDDQSAFVKVSQEPVGVCALVLPWNYPVGLLSWKLAPCLLAGNAALVKPSSHAPLTVLRCLRAISRSVPDNVVQAVPGDATTGQCLVSHPGIDKVSFTGSQDTGRAIMASAAPRLHRLSLELGGNDPAIVLPDCDIEERFPGLFWGCFYNAGQICIAIKRLYVHESRMNELLNLFRTRLAGLKVGNGLEPGTEMGPLNNREGLEKVQGLVAEAVDRGAEILCGGARYQDTIRSQGYFYQPTVLTDLDEGFRIVSEEQFGPAIPILTYTDIDEAIDRANATDFGLGGSVWTEDMEKGTSIAKELECGIAWVNAHMLLEHSAPFGGMKRSGMGRELGRPGLDGFLQHKTIYARR